MHRAEGGGVDGHSGRAEVVVAHRLHAHDGEETADHRQLFGRAHPDGAVALHGQAAELAGPAQPGFDIGRFVHDRLVGRRDQLQQGAVERDFRLVHVRHGAGKLRANLVRADEPLVVHGEAVSWR
ncbi:hypothetical protein D9M71_249890 [compost metagenome]